MQVPQSSLTCLQKLLQTEIVKEVSWGCWWHWPWKVTRNTERRPPRNQVSSLWQMILVKKSESIYPIRKRLPSKTFNSLHALEPMVWKVRYISKGVWNPNWNKHPLKKKNKLLDQILDQANENFLHYLSKESMKTDSFRILKPMFQGKFCPPWHL